MTGIGPVDTSKVSLNYEFDGERLRQTLLPGNVTVVVVLGEEQSVQFTTDNGLDEALMDACMDAWDDIIEAAQTVVALSRDSAYNRNKHASNHRRNETNMTTNLIEVPVERVPRGRGSNPFLKSVEEIAADLVAKPGVWFIIGSGDDTDRSRLNNAAAMLSGNKYKKLAPYIELGQFQTRVSGAKNAPHRKDFDVAVYARFIPNGSDVEVG